MAIALTWVVMAALVGLGTLELRDEIRKALVGRDADALLAMARAQPDGDDPESLLASDVFGVFLAMSRLDGIIAARFFRANGAFEASVPVSVHEATVPAEVLAILREGRPVSRFVPELWLEDVLLPVGEPGTGAAAQVVPAVEVYVPLAARGSRDLEGVGGFVIDGRGMAREFARLDARLVRQSGLVLASAMVVTGVALGWVFRRLARTQRLLAVRTGDLHKAHRELAQSARTAALGAVTAHLIHGLRNPVSGLKSFMDGRVEGGESDEGAWGEAQAAMRRMQTLIDQVVRVLREHESDLAYEVSAREVGEAVFARARPLAEDRGVRLRLEGDPRGALSNRTSGLLALLLTNLVENGVQATDAGGTVTLRVGSEDGSFLLDVIDEGVGLEARVRDQLFQPQKSTKEGGSGLGLAITRQLALALGATVSLTSTGTSGTTFRVQLPHESSQQSRGAEGE